MKHPTVTGIGDSGMLGAVRQEHEFCSCCACCVPGDPSVYWRRLGELLERAPRITEQEWTGEELEPLL